MPEADRQAQRVLEQQHQQERERAERFHADRDSPPHGTEPDLAPAEPGAQGGCTTITEVELVGMTRFGEAEFVPVLAALKSSCTDISTIDAALRAITNRYIRDGFVTSRALVGPQDLAGGRLVITVIEGRLQGVAAAAGAGRYGRRELDFAFPRDRAGLLNLRALEQGTDQLARMGKADPRLDITPGDGPATSLVLVHRERLAPWLRPSLSFNNDGAASTGRAQALAGLELDSLLGLADSWSLYYQRSAAPGPMRGTTAYGGFVSLPHGWWLLSLSVGMSRYHSVLAGGGLGFVTRGQTWNASASLERLVHRNARTKLSVSAGLAVIDTRNFIQGIRLRTGSYRVVSGRLGLRWQRRLGRSQASLGAGLERGLGLFGAHSVDAGPGGPAGRYGLASVDGALLTPFTIGPTRFTNTAVWRGQWGFDNLLPAQRFSLGGAASVRGFRDDGLSGRSGASLREQVGFGIARVARGRPQLTTALSGYLAYDVGVIRTHPGDPYERGLLQSAGAGIKAQSRHLQAELSLSVPVTAPSWVRHPAAVVSGSVRLLL